MSVLGTRVRRVEDSKFLTAGGCYVDDLPLDGALRLTYVRSPVAHARLLAVDATLATELPGVVAVLTAAELDQAVPQPPFGLPAGFARPYLATDRLRFVGEPVAAVLSTSRAIGEDAAELVVVEFEPLPAVVDPRAAVRDETLLFPAAGTNVATTTSFGEMDGLFDGCEVVLSRQIVNSRVAPAPLEPRATAATPSQDGRLTVWVSTQNPFLARDAIATATGLPPSDVHVIAPDVGGGFGAKIGISHEDVLVAVLAHRLGRPVRWAETRTESLQAMGHGRAQLQTFTIGGRRDGTIEAYALQVIADAGAYPGLGAMLPTMTQLMTTGVYRIERAAFASRSVVTNTCPTLAYRGAGRPEAAAAIERAVDCFAAEIGRDPAEVRRANFIPPDAFPYVTPAGASYDSGDYAAALDAVLAAADYPGLRAEQAARRAAGDPIALGIGMSAYVEVTGDGPGGGELARIEVAPDASVTVFTGISPHGQGHATSLAMIAADRLGIPLDRITVRHGDTDDLERGTGTMGSRSLQLGGSAVAVVADTALAEARRIAAGLFEAAPDDVVLDADRGVFQIVGSPAETRSWAEVATAAGGLSASGGFEVGDSTFPFGAHLAVVEVDTETGRVRLLRLLSVDDAGVLVNPVTAEGQRHGGLAQGAAQALQEEFVYDADGNPLTANFADYAIVTAPDLPSFELLDSATPTPRNPLGVKGIGESGAIGSTPAVQNAIVDALAHLNVRHVDLPATGQAVWRAIRAAEGSPACS